MKGNRASFAVILICAAAMCFAPIKDTRQNVKLEPEKTEAVRQSEQGRYQGTQRPIAPAPADTDANQMGAGYSDSGAASNISRANGKLDGNASDAGKDIVNATSNLQNRKAQRSSWLWGAIFGVLGFGVVMAVRQYANKTVPEYPVKKKPSAKYQPSEPVEVSVKRPKW